jgi:hypothetical protein
MPTITLSNGTALVFEDRGRSRPVRSINGRPLDADDCDTLATVGR